MVQVITHGKGYPDENNNPCEPEGTYDFKQLALIRIQGSRLFAGIYSFSLTDANVSRGAFVWRRCCK